MLLMLSMLPTLLTVAIAFGTIQRYELNTQKWPEQAMGFPRKGFMIRLPRGAMEKQFVSLCQRFRGLPPSAVLRMLVCDVLSRTLEEQVQAVHRQIHGEDNERENERILPTRNTNRVRPNPK